MSRYGSVSRTTLMNTTWLASNGRQGRRAQSYVPPLNGLSVSAAAAFSTRLLTSAYLGKAMNVRRSSDNATQDIGFANGVLDTGSLLNFVNNAGQPLNAMTATAAAAFSTRLLRSAYAGKCMNVRRSSDNTAQDIGFVNGVLDTASLLAFVGSGDGFVTTWYDQSGNGFNVTQATAASQPQIVSAGSTILTNGRPSIYFNGSTNLQSASVTTTPASFNGVVGVTAPVSNFYGIISQTFNYHLALQSANAVNSQFNTNTAASANNVLAGAGLTPSAFVATAVSASASQFDFVNGTQVASGAATTVTAQTASISVGLAGGVWPLTGYIAEATIFTTSLSTADQAILEKSQGFYYGIQIAGAAPTFNGFVTTWYDQSGNSANGTQATATNQMQIVSSGVVTTTGGFPALFSNTAGATPQYYAIAGQSATSNLSFNIVLNITGGVGSNCIIGSGSVATPGTGGNFTLYVTAGQAWEIARRLQADLFISTLAATGAVPQIITATTASGGALLLSKNGTVQTTTNAPAFTTAINSLGDSLISSSSSGFTGYMNEAILFNSTLSTADRQSLERNQEAYYGIAGV